MVACAPITLHVTLFDKWLVAIDQVALGWSEGTLVTCVSCCWIGQNESLDVFWMVKSEFGDDIYLRFLLLD